MRAAHTPLEQHTWFGAASLPSTMMAPGSHAAARDDGESTSFARLWSGFMSARVLLALTLVALHSVLGSGVRAVPVWLLALSLAYLTLTVLVRLLARPRGPGRSFDAQWLYTVGADLAFFITLQTQQASSINYTPLLALPVLMAAIMGSRALALGTAALTTLILLGNAAWSAGRSESTADIVQAGLTGAGLLLLSLLTNQLSMRLAREEAMVRRSRSETQMQSLVNNLVIEALPDGVLVVDASQTVRAANPAAHLMLGADQEVTPDQFSLLDNPAWVQLAHVVHLTFKDGPIDAVEITLHHEDRHSSRLQARTQRTPSIGDGGAGLCVVFLQDLREMEARLRTEKLAAMGRMSAAVAHEIRNPLAAISQANALLEEDLSSPTQQRLAAMVRQNAQRLGNIVDDVLNVARVQGVSEPGAVQTLGLDDEVQTFCREWLDQNRAAASRLRLSLQAPDVLVQFTREHLRRVLVNLLDNAARYASQRAGAIQVSTHAARRGPAMLMVWSDGAPMEASVQRHLFEPFFSSEARSSGLGLFICRELCERHGASISQERTQREQDGREADGNEFFVSFRRAHGAHSILPSEGTNHP